MSSIGMSDGHYDEIDLYIIHVATLIVDCTDARRDVFIKIGLDDKLPNILIYSLINLTIDWTML
jgi:hypothetical protein